jgi:tRNA threonylcarbamoyladenosine biosynthesis protein TsaE
VQPAEAENTPVTVVSRSSAETEALGHSLAGILRPGDVLFLMGELGAGKTTLVRGLHAGLGCRGRVRSPSFMTLLEYGGPLPVFHFDLYRYDAAGSAFLDEFGEWLEADGVAVVEWAERFGGGGSSIRLEIGITVRNEERVIELRGKGGDWDTRLAALAVPERRP